MYTISWKVTILAFAWVHRKLTMCCWSVYQMLRLGHSALEVKAILERRGDFHILYSFLRGNPIEGAELVEEQSCNPGGDDAGQARNLGHPGIGNFSGTSVARYCARRNRQQRSRLPCCRRRRSVGLENGVLPTSVKTDFSSLPCKMQLTFILDSLFSKACPAVQRSRATPLEVAPQDLRKQPQKHYFERRKETNAKSSTRVLSRKSPRPRHPRLVVDDPARNW